MQLSEAEWLRTRAEVAQADPQPSRFSPVVAYSFLQVFRPARVAAWRAFEVPWGHFSPFTIMSAVEKDCFKHRSGPILLP